ncbi:Fic family protein [Brevibacterium litoralis]|uniref:Fic family protein n=1 Tax=Brevibacterium litoralis TaxID=3138935 RepID=UPI0032EDD082
MTWDPDTPYDDLPELPPVAEFETKEVLRATANARAALAALDQASRRIPNPEVLINSISLLEAQASSEIENIVTTTDDLFRYAHDGGGSASSDTKETLRYRTALFAGIESIRTRPVSTNTAIEVCSEIRAVHASLRSMPGTYIGNPTTDSRIYTPPENLTRIRALLRNWESFVHESAGIDPLIVMAIAHYQFEAIHPFADGNGRTGRILNVLLLVAEGLLVHPVLYLSRYIIERKVDYYRKLQAVTAEQAWEDWILFMLDGVRASADSTMRTIDAIESCRESVRAVIRDDSRLGTDADLIDLLFENPYCRINDVRERCGVSRPTATKRLRALVHAGVLTEHRTGRTAAFRNEAFHTLLQDTSVR